MGLAYPTLGQEISSAMTILDDVIVEKASNGLVKMRGFYTSPIYEFSVSHTVNSLNKNILLNHYYGICSFSGSISTTTLTVSSVSSGSIVSGMTISGSTVTAGTTVVAQLSGISQSIGTYSVSTSQTVSGPTNLTATMANKLDSFSFIWNQDATTHICRYTAPPKINLIGPGFFTITNSLIKV